MIGNSRADFALDQRVAHLNHGSFGSVPIVVRQERQRLLDEFDSNPMGLVAGDLWDRVGAARATAARFLGADPESCAFVNNATHGAAIVLNTVGIEAGDEIVITDHSYNAVTVAARDYAARFGARVVVAPIDLEATDTVDVITGLVTERTKLVIVDDISSATAQRHPIAELAQRLRALGIQFFVDAAHTPGMIPEPLAGFDPDFWVGNLHKWAFTPGGAAIFRVAPAWRDRVIPLVISHAHDEGFPHHVEHQGTRDFTTWLTVDAALSVFEQYGQSTIQRHNTDLAAYGQKVIGEALGLDPTGLPHPGEGVSMRIIPLPEGLVNDHNDAMLLRNRIAAELATEVAINMWRGKGLLRVSAQIYNSADEYEKLAINLPTLLAK